MAKIGANAHYVPDGRRPARPGHLRRQDQRAGLHGLPVQDEQTGGHCPTLAEHFTGTKQKWFTFTNGAHIDSLDPETYNRWYDFLRAVRRAPGADRRTPRRSSAAAPVIYQEAMGLRSGVDAAARPDPAAADVRRGARRVRAAAAGPGAVRQRRRAVASPASRDPRLRAVLPELPDPGHRRPRSWYFGPGGALADGRPPARGVNSFTWNAARAAADRLQRRHRPGPAACGATPPVLELEQNPAGTRGLLRHRAADGEHDRRRRRRRAPLGALLDARRRPAGDDQRGPAGREGDLRAERLDARQRAQARPRRKSTSSSSPSSSLREPPTSTPMPRRPVRQGRDPALLPGPRLPRGLADPGDDRRAERRPADLVVRPDAARSGTANVSIALLAVDAVEPGAAGRARRDRADRRCRRARACATSPAGPTSRS